jgi:haloalkane dehalogenase
MLREFAKSALSLSWAMSLFGLRQATSVLASRPPGDQTDAGAGLAERPTESMDQVTSSVVDHFGDSLRQTFSVGDRLQREIIDTMFRFLTLASGREATSTGGTGWHAQDGGSADRIGQEQVLPTVSGFNLPILAARTGAQEEVIISYTRGRGRFSTDKRYITLDNRIFLLDGREYGYHQGVWQRLFDNPQALIARPDPPVGPLDQPVGPVPKGPVAAATKAVWAFNDGAIYSVGPAASHLIPLSDGSFLFLVSTAQVITNGTGRFQGAFGMTQSLGATHVPEGVDLFGGEPVPFPATTLDTFKIRVVANSPQLRVPVRRPTRSTGEPARDPGQIQACADLPGSKTVDVLGSRMHYLEQGSGGTVLFLHGNPTWSYLWRNVLPHVAGTARCIAPDLIGMGKSDKPAINYRFFDLARYLDAFIETLGLCDVTLVIHDWGSALGLFYAMRNAKNVRGIAMMEALIRPYASWDEFPASLRQTFQAFRTANVGYEKIVVENVFVEQLLPNSMIRRLSAEEMDCYRMPFREPASRKVIWRLANDLPIAGKPADVTRAVTDYSRWLKSSSIPKLLLSATPGAITTEAGVRWCQSNWEAVSVQYIGNGIHFHQEDNPEAVGRAVARWYATLP